MAPVLPFSVTPAFHALATHRATDAMYVALLLLILLTQEGNNVTQRYSVTQTLSDYVNSVEGDGGILYEDIKTMKDFGVWLETGFYGNFDLDFSDGTATWKMKTYNVVC